jgi:3-phenylpropionate/cinnamic acid dioxygenase small subunit
MVVGHEQTGDQAPVTKDLPREIALLKARYCQWLDGKEWDRWASLFTEDAVLQVGPSADATVRGRAGIKRLLTRQLRRARTLHQVWEPELTPESSGCVRVVWKMRDRVETPLYVLEGEGFYEDRYVQSDDAWKIASVRLHRNKVELRPKSLIMRAILWMYANGWLARLSGSVDRTLGEALYVGLAPGERP